MKAREEKELLEGKKNAMKMLTMDDTDTIVLVTNNGTAVLGTTEQICRAIAKLFVVLKANKFPGVDVIKEAIDFACLSDKEQKERLKQDLQQVMDEIDSIKTDDEKE